MPRRKQSNPQPVKLASGDRATVCEQGCLVLESDFLLSGDLGFGDSEIMGLDRDSGLPVFSLSVEDEPPADATFAAFLSCKGCGRLIGDAPLGAGLQLGVGPDLEAELYCLACVDGLQRAASAESPPPEGSDRADRSDGNSGGEGKAGGAGVPAKLYSCSLCAFASRYSNHLKRHMRIHDGQKPYRCPACPYASAQLVNLQRHARTHTGEKPYGCPQCSYACSSLGNLRRHQRMHAQERPPRREKDRRRGRRKKLDRDADGVMSELALRVSQDSAYLQTLGGLSSPSGPLPVLLFPLRCRLCGLTLEEADLEGDKAEDEDGDGGQVCRRCSPANGGAGSPRRSRRGQRGGKLYRCPRCPFLSRYPNHLARHAHTHSEEKPHRCPHCAYTSSHPDNLKRHLRVHTGEKPYQCPSCSYACGNLANLRRHERIHSGAKPFHCHVCGYSCNQSMNLKRHMLRHTGEKPYACGECGYTTGHLDNYKRHQRKHGHRLDAWERQAADGALGWAGDTQGGQRQEAD